MWVHSNSSDAYTLHTTLPLGGGGCKEVHGGVDGCIVKIYQGCLVVVVVVVVRRYT